MRATKLKDQLQFAIPEELYEIEPGQIAYFVPPEGISKKFLSYLNSVHRYLSDLDKDREINISIVPTSNELLIGAFAGRSPQEVGAPYKVMVAVGRTIAGFASQLFGEEIEAIVKRIPDWVKYGNIYVTTDFPAVAEIDPNYRPDKKSTDLGGDFSDDPGMGMLQKRPETDKERKDLVDKYEQKFRKMLWECAYLGIDFNKNGIVEEVELNKTKTEGYGLSLQMEKNKTSGRIDCKVFVGDGLEMKVTAVRKAVYLAFLTLEDGLVIEEATPAFTRRIQKIYRQLPDREEKEEKEGGLLYVDYIQSKTLRGYMSDINSAIAKLVPNGLIAIELSIEGLKEGAFKVIRSTPEIREQIIKAFNL